MSHLPEAILHLADRSAAWAGIGRDHLDADALMEAALQRAGRRAFSDLSFVLPLRQLLRSCEEEADLSVFGHYAARFDIARSLDNLLAFDAAEEADPELGERPIRSPLFITGLPRSGTTFLHTLLSLDPANTVARSWQLIYPYPDHPHRDRRRARVDRQLRFFRHLSPELEGMHPITADTPQECTDITAQVFQSLRFDSTYNVPSYQRWIDACGHDRAFRFHRRFLQHLDAQAPGRRWVLKCPDHVFTLDALRKTYPDARLVMLHRDPLEVLASVAKLTDLLRRPFTRHVDRNAIGRQVSERWIEGGERMARLSPSDPAILHLHYRDVVSAPLDAVRRVYRHWGAPLDDRAETLVADYVARRPRGGYRRHRHSLEDYGLDAARLRERFAGYVGTFGLAPGSAHDVRSTQSAA